MGKLIKNPRYDVVSMRISEEERKNLEKLIDSKSKSVSGIMRDALDMYYSLHIKPVREKTGKLKQ